MIYDQEESTMKQFIAILLMILATGMLTACTTGQKQTAGIVGGGVVGGVAGSAITGGSPIGAAVGAIGGAVVGNQLTK
jgi:osmotically inducible lipoprotein OsmB